MKAMKMYARKNNWFSSNSDKQCTWDSKEHKASEI